MMINRLTLLTLLFSLSIANASFLPLCLLDLVLGAVNLICSILGLGSPEPTMAPSKCGTDEYEEALWAVFRDLGYSDSDAPQDPCEVLSKKDGSSVCLRSGGMCVEKIDIFNEKMTGTLSSYIGVLKELDELDLSLNFLTGSLPSELGLLSNIRELNLISSELKGTLPSEIGYMSNDKILASFGKLAISLSFNNFDGTLPTEIGNIEALSSLDVTDNELKGDLAEFSEVLETKEKLTDLQFSRNDFSGSVPSKLPKQMVRLYVGDNEDMGFSIPTEIGGLSELKNLKLNKNNLTGTIPLELYSLKKLWELDVSGNEELSGDLTKFCTIITEQKNLTCDDTKVDCAC